MPRQENLTVIKAGLSRERIKGAAAKDTLYDLLNGYVTTEKTVKVRPGTARDQSLTTGTKGLVHFDNEFHVFSDQDISVPAGYQNHILKSPDDSTLALTRIHFAEPFLGALYVVAEFADGGIYHYWLQGADAWEASEDYQVDEIVAPTSANGFVYKARRLAAANAAWSPNTPRLVNDVVEPTVQNGFKYTVTDTVGSAPRSGSVEPVWPTKPGATIIEDLDVDDIAAPDGSTPPTPGERRDRFVDDDRRRRYDRDGRRRR